jgi:hypothetical protein
MNRPIASIAILLAPLYSLAIDPPQIINIRQQKDTVGLFEKFKIALSVKAEFVNPLDPDEIDISGTLRSMPWWAV